MSLEEAESACLDEDGLQIAEPEHSDSEDRFILLGLSQQRRILVVCHCFRAGDEVIRIISARKANARERAVYEERRSR